MNLEIFVRAGQIISATTWNALAAVVTMIRLVAGPGVAIRSTPSGTVISLVGNPNIWLHDFKVTLNGTTSANIRPGFLDGAMPTIGDQPLDPEDGGKPPILEWIAPKLDRDGRGWIAIEGKFGEDWETLSAEIVQVSDLDHDDNQPVDPNEPVGYPGGGTLTLPNRRARHPLAMLRRRKNGDLVAFQITRFSLKHRVAVIGAHSESGRHFFSPA